MVFESRNRTGSERLTSHRRRSGLVIVLTALLLVFFLGMIAFAVDLGIIANTRTELQMAADAAAYAGAGALVNGSTAAVDEAKAFYGKNRAGGATLTPDTAAGLTQHLGVSPRWLDHVPMGGASGVVAVRRAARAAQRAESS